MPSRWAATHQSSCLTIRPSGAILIIADSARTQAHPTRSIGYYFRIGRRERCRSFAIAWLSLLARRAVSGGHSLTDVSNIRAVEALAQQTLDMFGAVHLLCNNAGVAAGTTIWDSTLADWEWVLAVNLWGVIYGVRVFVPIMLSQDTDCHIVNTASIAGLIAGPGLGVYKVD